MTTIYQLFCKTPVKGRVKTRLQLPDAAALAVHVELTELALQALEGQRGDSQRGGGQRGDNQRGECQRGDSQRGGGQERGKSKQGEIWCYPSLDNDYLRGKRQDGWDLRLQQGDDLGERMAAALEDGLGRANQVVLFGADCPVIDSEYLSLAGRQLANSDLVIGPSEDGGYGLIGMRVVAPEVFQGINWGTGTVLEETLRQVERLGLDCQLLPEVWDVDRPADLQRYRAWRALSL